MERVSSAPSRSSLLTASASDAVLKGILDNKVAYELAASSGTMTRDLEVLSEPEGATVSYWQRGDAEPKVLDHETNSQIQNMYRAFYFIQFQKQGYQPIKREFNGNTSTSTYIMVKLVPDGPAR
jgi:hypothetical protein